MHDDVPPPSTLVDGIPPYLDAFVARATSRAARPAAGRRARHAPAAAAGHGSALDHGVIDDQELTDDLTPTLPVAVSSATAARPAAASAIAVPGGPLLPSADPGGAADDVFDISAYDDFIPTQIRPLEGGPGGIEQTLTVDAGGPIDLQPVATPLPPDRLQPPPRTPASRSPPPFHPHSSDAAGSPCWSCSCWPSVPAPPGGGTASGASSPRRTSSG